MTTESIRQHLNIINESLTTDLNEDLGNLKSLNPDFLPAFGRYHSYLSKDEHQPGKLSGNKEIGPNSPVESVDIGKGKATDITKLIDSDSENSLMGLVVELGGKQVLLVLKNKGKNWKDPAAFVIQFDRNFYQSLDSKERSRHNNGKTTAGKVMDLLRLILKMAKETGQKVGVLTLKSDTARAEKRKEREENRRSATAYQQQTNPKFKDEAKRALRSRLDKFKANNALSIDSADKFLEVVLDKGYLEKIKIGEWTYKLKDDRINFRSLSSQAKTGKTDSFYGASYIEYGMDDGDRYSERWHAIRRKASEEGRDVEIPTTFKIILELQGGRIVPVKVVPETSIW